MDRLTVPLAVAVLFALCLWGMKAGRRCRAREQSAGIPPFPAVPEDPGNPVLPETTGLYVSATTAGHWQDRVITGKAGEALLDAGFRGDDLDLYPQWIEAVLTARPQDREDNASDSKGGAR